MLSTPFRVGELWNNIKYRIYVYGLFFESHNAWACNSFKEQMRKGTMNAL